MANKVERPQFMITRQDWIKIQHYAKYAHQEGGNEIGGMMVMSKTTFNDKPIYQMYHPVILEQEISGGNTILSAEALAVHYSKMSDKFGKDIRHVWWHSHHTMGAFWSGTDNDTIMQTKTPDFSVSLVINLFQEYKLRVQWFHPIEHEENVPLLILDKQLIEDVPQYIAKECDKLCSERTVVSPTTYNGYNRINHINPGIQANIFDASGHLDDELDPQFPNLPSYMMIYDWLEDNMGKLIMGEVGYDEFRRTCEESNLNLKEQKNPFRIKMFKKKKLMKDMYTMNTRDFIDTMRWLKGGAGNGNYNKSF